MNRVFRKRIAQRRTAVVDIPIPTTPVIYASPKSDTRIDLSWTPSVGQSYPVTRYDLYRNGSFLMSVTGTSYSNTGLTIDTEYTYTVEAVDSSNRKSLQSSMTARTFNSFSIDVSGAVSDGSNAYKLDYNFGTPADNSSSGGSGTPSWSQSLLLWYEDGVLMGPAHTLHADIRSLGAGRYSHWSNTDGTGASIRFSASDNSNPTTNGKTYSYKIVSDNIAPTIPQGLSGSSSTFATASLSWSASTDNVGIKEYRIYRDNVHVGASTSPTLTYDDSGLTGDTVYRYTVTAVDNAGNECLQSEPFFITTPAEPAPYVELVPSNLRYLADIHEFRVDVTNTGTAASPAATWFGCNYQVDNVVQSWGNKNSDTSIAAGETVTFLCQGGPYTIPSGTHTIKAVIDDSNVITESNETNNTITADLVIESPDVTAPSVPTGLTVSTLSSTSVRLTWLASTDDSSGVQGYKVYKNGVFVTNVTGGALTYDDTGLATNSTFDYQISAYDNAGTPNESAKCAVVIGSTILKSDLIVTDVRYSESTHTFVADVTNQGNAATDPAGTAISVAFFSDGVYRTWGNVAGPLAAGASVTINTLGDPYTIPSGTHVIAAQVNDQVTITNESNTSNNTASKIITVSGSSPTGIEGFAKAANVTGGTGGASIVVTNLNSSGAGSLAAAINTPGPRVITFTFGLSGTINFPNVVYVPYNDMTIDGASANITISGYSLSVFKPAQTPVKNIIIKNLTFDGTEPTRNAIFIEYGSYNVWVDHCTFRNQSLINTNTGQGIAVWDRGLGYGAPGQPGLTGITVSWCKFEPINHKGMLISAADDYTELSTRVSMHHNWFDGISGRSPRLGAVTVHMWNNYISNWSEYGTGISGAGDLLYENNIYEKANGGTGVDANYGGLNSNSCNGSGNWAIGTPAPTLETIGAFPTSRITYSYTLETANQALKDAIMAGAGANNG